jgi:hypothetical protein
MATKRELGFQSIIQQEQLTLNISKQNHAREIEIFTGG